MVLGFAAILCASICQDAQQADLMLCKERDHAVVQQISGGDGGLLGVKLADRHAGIGVDDALGNLVRIVLMPANRYATIGVLC